MEPIYDDRFFADQAPASLASARAVVPLLEAIIQPSSVIDVGCGIGSWLQAFDEMGTTDILGIDGHSVPQQSLLIPVDQFLTTDLPRIPTVGRRFDLVLCLEVAEHLPSHDADPLIAQLTSLSDVVVFSAAIPGQTGVGHVNEQWPSYWTSLFARYEYRAFDILRPLVWADRRIAWWYRQNLIVYAHASYAFPSYDHEYSPNWTLQSGVAPLVHPEAWESIQAWNAPNRSRLWSALLRARRLAERVRARMVSDASI